MSSVLLRAQQEICRSFPARKFNPSYIRNPHYQTIVGSEALRLKFVGSYPRSFQVSRERVLTPDGDFFDVDYTANCNANDSTPIVLILHGLESNSQGPLVTKMTTAFLSKGFCCCLVSFRSCSGEDNLTPGAYHLGYTRDINHLVRTVITKKFPNKHIYLSGFSLGANVVLKYLGELGDSAADLNIAGAAVTCVPFDPVASQVKLDQGFNRAVYSMVRSTIYIIDNPRFLYALNHFSAYAIEFFKKFKSQGRAPVSSVPFSIRHRSHSSLRYNRRL